MAKFLGDLRDSVWSWTGSNERRLPIVDLNQIVNNVVEDISKRAPNTLDETSEDLSVLDGLWTTPAPADMRIPIAVYIDGSKLDFIPFREFFKKWTTISPGIPGEYTFWDDKLWFSKIAASGEAGGIGSSPTYGYHPTLLYYSFPTTVTDGVAHPYLTHLWDMIHSGSCKDASVFLIEDRRAVVFQSKFEQQLRRFVIEQNHRGHSAGRLISAESV